MSRQHRIKQIREKAAKAAEKEQAPVIQAGRIVAIADMSYKDLQSLARQRGLKSVGVSKVKLIESLGG